MGLYLPGACLPMSAFRPIVLGTYAAHSFGRPVCHHGRRQLERRVTPTAARCDESMGRGAFASVALLALPAALRARLVLIGADEHEGRRQDHWIRQALKLDRRTRHVQLQSYGISSAQRSSDSSLDILLGEIEPVVPEVLWR